MRTSFDGLVAAEAMEATAAASGVPAAAKTEVEVPAGPVVKANFDDFATSAFLSDKVLLLFTTELCLEAAAVEVVLVELLEATAAATVLPESALGSKV